MIYLLLLFGGRVVAVIEGGQAVCEGAVQLPGFMLQGVAIQSGILQEIISVNSKSNVC